jgi:hypothetical protein
MATRHSALGVVVCRNAPIRAAQGGGYHWQDGDFDFPLLGFQLLADAAQFDEAQCGHRAQHGSKRDHHNSFHRARAPPPLTTSGSLN